MIAPAPRTLTYILAQLYPLEFPQTEVSTLAKMQTHVNRWKLLTDDTPADLIDRPKLLEFRGTCLQLGYEPSTINGYLRTVTGLAKLAGNETKLDRLALAERDAPSPTPRPADLSRIWNLTRRCQWPHTKKVNARPIWCQIDPLLWWRGVLMLAFSTGLRRADLFSLKTSQIEPDRIPTINHKTKKPQFIPIPDQLRPWIALLKRNGTETLLSASHTTQQIDRELNRFANLADLPTFGLQGLRRAAARAYEKAHAGCGKLILNHGKTVTERHYLDVEETLRDAQPKLIYPESFLEPPSLDRQRLLF